MDLVPSHFCRFELETPSRPLPHWLTRFLTSGVATSSDALTPSCSTDARQRPLFSHA